jgi:hypothetical protein
MLDRSFIRPVFLERIVDPVVMVIGHVFPKQSPQVVFIQCNDVVDKLSAAASDPPLCYPVLPRGLNTRPLRLQTRALHERNHFGIEFRVAIQNLRTEMARLPGMPHATVGGPNPPLDDR